MIIHFHDDLRENQKWCVVQLSRYERIEEEGESRSGNYEKEGEGASEQGREGEGERAIA